MFELYHQTYTNISNWLHMFKKIGKRKSNWKKTWTTDFSNRHFNKDGTTEFSKNPYHRIISRNHTRVRSTTDHGSINDSIMISLSRPRTWPTTLGQHIHFSARCMFAPCSGRDLPYPIGQLKTVLKEAIKLPCWQDGWGSVTGLWEVVHQKSGSNHSQLILNSFYGKAAQ